MVRFGEGVWGGLDCVWTNHDRWVKSYEIKVHWYNCEPMRIDLDELEIKNNTELSRFEAEVNEFTAVIEYQLIGNKIIFIHTEVPDEISGYGIGGKMAKFALDSARDTGLMVVPQCPFVAGYIRRHPEYRDLVFNSSWEV